MLHLETPDSFFNARLPRRDWMKAGFLGLGGLTLSDYLKLDAAGAVTPKDTAVILLFAHGGPSHLETYDLKPEAPAEVRGPFSPITTTVSGIDICEHLPRHAVVADRFTLIRSCAHDEADHFAGHRRFLSGYGNLKPGTGYESFYPQVGAVVSRMLQQSVTGIPPAMALGGVVVNGPDYAAGVSEGFWSGVYRVPIVSGGLRDATLNIEGRRLDDRLALNRQLDQLKRQTDVNGHMDVIDSFNQKAVDIMLSGKVQKAFDLSQEDPKTRERFGPGCGQELLTARRLVEAGLRFVTVCERGNGPGSAAHNWDDHAVNWDMLTAMNARLPSYDHVVATMIDDLFDRGLDRRVLFIVTGEFGRTPRLEHRDGRIGRDHWPSAMSILFSGGGMPMGQVIGATNSRGEHPVERRFDPHDILATIYHHLGIDHTHHVLDPAGRPIPLTRGEPISELFV
ncbi:MAG: DUF1501 domain-containing protein [Planctomycetaceae bacterium]